jgi:glucose-1-phosphate cytidylyltransferase
VLSNKCLEFVESEACSWEGKPLRELSALGQMMAYEHQGFWQPMDTLREKNMLEDLWAAGKAPWKVW